MWRKNLDHITPRTWNHFVQTHGPISGQFLQSWQWGEFQKSVGQAIERWVWDEEESEKSRGVDDRRREGVALIMKKYLPGFGMYAYCPRGPVVVGDFAEVFKQLGEEIGSVLCVRSDIPLREKPHLNRLHKTIDQQPAMTRITNVQIPEDELFASLHHKTRYNIRLADRHDVHVRFDMQDLERVWPLFAGTSKRGQFRLHEKEYYRKMLESLSTPECHAFLATAWYEDKPVAANIMIDFGNVRTYLHGASSYEHRSLMAPHMLHWELMNNARHNGLTQYDWWGVAPEDQPHHPWAGISRFKRSFIGEDVIYAGTYDLVKKPVAYAMYSTARQISRLLRSNN